jgi:hypothetical protein
MSIDKAREHLKLWNRENDISPNGADLLRHEDLDDLVTEVTVSSSNRLHRIPG